VAAEVLGITSPDNMELSFVQAHRTVIGEPYDPTYYTARLDRSSSELSQNEYERLIDFRDLGEFIVGQSLVSASTFSDWPAYNSMMRTHGIRSNGSASALMIGSLTPLSSRSFIRFAKTEYGAADTHIVDIAAGDTKRRQGKFVYGSGLALPYASESMDFVHTNQLLHMLEDPSSPSRSTAEKRLLLFSEIARVLRPGGQLLMKECEAAALDPNTSAAECQRVNEQLCAFAFMTLKLFGVEYVQAGLSPSFNDVDALLDPKRNFQKHLRGINVAAVSIYAQRRPLD
jgi:SAM-dependent methyltransferase